MVSAPLVLILNTVPCAVRAAVISRAIEIAVAALHQPGHGDLRHHWRRERIEAGEDRAGLGGTGQHTKVQDDSDGETAKSA